MQKELGCPGEDEAWRLLASLDPAAVEANAAAAFDPASSTYELRCFGQMVRVSMKDRGICGNSRLGDLLVEGLSEFARPSILRYLIHARDVPQSGKLIKPAKLPGGEIFVRGTHVLPLDGIAQRFCNNLEGFLAKGAELGGVRLEYGDVSLKLAPFPRLPIVLIVWSGDEEFPANASLLLDSGCPEQMPTDVIWATTTMTLELMLR